jgi:hypothetical protein
MSIFLSELWEKNRNFCSLLLVPVLSLGLFSQYGEFKKINVSMKDFYKHYIYFFEGGSVLELFDNKPISVHKALLDKCNINVYHALGVFYAEKHHPVDLVKIEFMYISNANIIKLRYLYQGYIRQCYFSSKGDIKTVLAIIKDIDKKYWDSCYKGLGESIFAFNDNFNYFEKEKKNIGEISLLVQDDYRKFFFLGAGEGLAKRFAVAYSSYISKDKLYDEHILNNCANMINTEEYRVAFLEGFFNRYIWMKY